MLGMFQSVSHTMGGHEEPIRGGDLRHPIILRGKFQSVHYALT
jgi:hypothetical protein